MSTQLSGLGRRETDTSECSTTCQQLHSVSGLFQVENIEHEATIASKAKRREGNGFPSDETVKGKQAAGSHSNLLGRPGHCGHGSES